MLLTILVEIGPKTMESFRKGAMDEHLMYYNKVSQLLLVNLYIDVNFITTF